MLQRSFNCIDTSVLQENTPIVKFIRNYIGDSGNKDIDNFTDIKLVSIIVLKFVGMCSKHLQGFLKSLRQSLEIFGNIW